MKSVAFLSLLSLATAALVERDDSCPAPSSTITSTMTVSAANNAAVATDSALPVCSGEPDTITMTVTVSAAQAAVTSAAATDDSCPAPSSTITSTITVSAGGAAAATTAAATTAAATSAAAAATSAAAAATTTAASSAAGVNVQVFTGTLGGPPPPVISGTGTRPFTVKGDTFVGENAALGRSCDVQHNACANAANSGSITGGVAQCETQNTACHAANNLRKRSSGRFMRF